LKYCSLTLFFLINQYRAAHYGFQMMSCRLIPVSSTHLAERIMSFKSRLYTTAALLSFLGLAPLASAQAGSLFPPDNIGKNPNVCCPNGQVLGWTGSSVECINPTPGVTVSCPAGEVLTGITKGVANCAAVSVSCPAGEVLTGIDKGAPLCVALPAGTPTTPTALPYPSSITCYINGTDVIGAGNLNNPPVTVYFSSLQNQTYVYALSSAPIAGIGIMGNSGNKGSVVYDATSGQLLNNSATTMPGEPDGADNVYSITCPSTLP
jgi:hypothetical protein